MLNLRALHRKENERLLNPDYPTAGIRLSISDVVGNLGETLSKSALAHGVFFHDEPDTPRHDVLRPSQVGERSRAPRTPPQEPDVPPAHERRRLCTSDPHEGRRDAGVWERRARTADSLGLGVDPATNGDESAVALSCRRSRRYDATQTPRCSLVLTTTIPEHRHPDEVAF